MDIPSYIKIPNSENYLQENYFEEINQNLRDNLGPNGFVISQITTANLLTTPILNPNTGQYSTVQDLMPIGTIWFVIDQNPPIWVGKISANPTVLRQFSTAAFP